MRKMHGRRSPFPGWFPGGHWLAFFRAINSGSGGDLPFGLKPEIEILTGRTIRLSPEMIGELLGLLKRG